MKIDYKNSVVIGTGYSVDTFMNSKNCQEILNSNTVVSFQAAFHYAKQKYDIFPDVWMWSDPHASLEGLDFILNNKNIFQSGLKSLQIVIPNFVDTSFRHIHKDYAGTSPAWRDAKMGNYYYDSLEKIKKIKNIQVRILDVYTTKLITRQQELTRDCKNIFKNPVERFLIDRPIIGSFKYETDNSYINPWGRENKLSFFVFPVLQYLGCKSLGSVGFDFGGTRFYSDNDMHAFNFLKDELSKDPTYKIVNTWAKEWYKYHNMKIYSLVGPGESGLNDILES